MNPDHANGIRLTVALDRTGWERKFQEEVARLWPATDRLRIERVSRARYSNDKSLLPAIAASRWVATEKGSV